MIQQRQDIGGTAKDRYLCSDLLYRGVALTDTSVNIVEAYDCSAYGDTIVFNAAGTGGDWWADDASTSDSPTNQFIFTGRRFDPETQLYYYRMRYYGSELGRFVSKDPFGYWDGMNMYLYVIDNPIASVDPFGQQAEIYEECILKCQRHAAWLQKLYMQRATELGAGETVGWATLKTAFGMAIGGAAGGAKYGPWGAAAGAAAGGAAAGATDMYLSGVKIGLLRKEAALTARLIKRCFDACENPSSACADAHEGIAIG